MSKQRVEYNKLVRDFIPELIDDNGSDEQAIYHQADDEEFEELLTEKLREEVEEFIEDPSVEEMVDLMDVIDECQDHFDISEPELVQERVRKHQTRGRFEGRIVLDAVEGTEVRDA